MLLILVSLCGLIFCVSQHKHLLVHLSCHSITKTKQGPFTPEAGSSGDVDGGARTRPHPRAPPFRPVSLELHRCAPLSLSPLSNSAARSPWWLEARMGWLEERGAWAHGSARPAHARPARISGSSSGTGLR